MITLLCAFAALAAIAPTLLLCRLLFIIWYRKEVREQYGWAALSRLPSRQSMYWDFFRMDWSSWLRI